MALEIKAVTREQVFYYSGTTVNAGVTLPETTDVGSGAAGAYIIYKSEGCVRVLGIAQGSAAPAAGFPRIRFWMQPGNANAFTAVAAFALTVDPNNANTYVIDFPLYSPYFSIEWTQGAAGGTFNGIAWVTPDGGGGSTSSASPPPPPTPVPLPATYRVAFDGIAAAGTGQFLELRNPAASGRVLRCTLQFLTKPSAQILWKSIFQSSLSTGGTSTTPTPVPLDSTNVATVGVVKLYTVVPAAGALVGNLFDETVSSADTFADNPGSNTNLTQPVVLRAGQSIAWSSDVAATVQGLIEFTDAVN